MKAIVFVFALAAACAAATLPSLANDKLVVALNSGIVAATAPFYIGKDKGYFEAEGLDVEFAKSENPVTVTATLLSHSADIATTGIAAAFYNVAANEDLRIIAGGLAEAPGFKNQVIMVSNAAYAKGLRTPADLAGHRIGITATGTAGHYGLLLLGQKYHFPILASNVVALQTNGALTAAAQTGSADAVLLTALPALALQKSGEAKIIAWAGDEVQWELAAVFTRKDVIDSKREMLVRFARAYLRACAEYAAAFEQKDAQGALIRGPGADALLDILVKNTGQPRDLVVQSLPYIEPNGLVEESEFAKQIATWKQAGVLPESLKGDGIVDLSMMRQVQK